MIQDRKLIWEDGECTYKNGKYQLQYIDTYIHSDDEKRPGILVVPGGGYDHVSPRESENVAMKFFEMGYQAFVLNYTVDETKLTPLKLQPLKDISRAVRYIRSREEEYKLFEGKLAVCGFSAGGHLAASLCIHHSDIEDELYPNVNNRPDACVLCYPVITMGNYAHKGSMMTLLGEMATMDEIKYMCLEKQVTEEMPPVFIWTTALDKSVPIENSMLFFQALREKEVKCSLHIFSEGRHGRNLGTATEDEPEIPEIMVWPELADSFLGKYML